MKNPTAYSGIIAQMVTSVDQARQHYDQLVTQAVQRYNSYRPTPKFKADKYDRVY